MAAGRSLRSLVSRRRRVGDDGEDEDGPVMVEDSQSEGSILTDAEDEGADASSAGDGTAGDGQTGGPVEATSGEQANGGVKPAKKARKSRKKGKKGKEQEQSAESSGTNFKAAPDTDAMMNGLRIDDAPQTQDAVAFEDMGGKNGNKSAGGPSGAPSTGNTGDRNRREHEEYRKKRDTDPAFIPNRGNFFMHDTRSHHNGQAQPPLRGAWQGRGRGRGAPAAVGGPFSPANQMARAEQAAEQPWKHDLHDTINEEPNSRAADPSQQQTDKTEASGLFPKDTQSQNQPHPRVVSFSTTTLVGKVQIRVSLPGMKAPISFTEVPWKHYIRLPNHRPPLRRDKPVRVSLPEHTQRYIFPSPDRSFIFIPRQMRPNQQGYGRNNQRSVGGYGYSSRRTSMYGGSMYSASVAASRRSSMAGISRADAFSPSSFGSGSRPVVRMPYGQQPFSGVTTPSGPLSGQHTPTGMHVHTYPLPQQPTYQGTPTTSLHQPRPQKTISVTGIESPAVLQSAQQSQEALPFHNQLPPHMNDQGSGNYGQQANVYFSPRQQYQYPQQPPSGTPLNGIPEQSMHGAQYQTQNMGYGQSGYYQPYQGQQGYYYPQMGQSGYQQMPMYMQQQQSNQGYMMQQGQAQQHQQAPQAQQGAQSSEEPAQAPSGMVAHESNGMVFYLPAAEAQQQSTSENYQPAESFVPNYAMPGLPPPTPAPDTSYYYQGQAMPQQSMYYPPQA